jgi:hypothetical protein
MYICKCKDCKKAARMGKVLGDRKMGYWLPYGALGEYKYQYGNVSAYVNFPKFMKGRIREERRVDIDYIH